MDKYEFNIKVEQMKKKAKLGDYETAMKIADAIDWRRVQNVSLLSLVSEIYEKNGDFDESKEILLIAFERAPIGKGLLYKLTKLALRNNSLEEAEAYYREFYDLAPEDSRQYILRYLILKAKGAPIDQLIHSLETYNHEELNEQWMYELAELYHEAGRSEDCVKMCDNIMLMFGLGKYVDKAIELKTEKEGQPLTQYQQSLIDNRDKYEEKLKKVEEEYGDPEDAEEEYPETGEEDAEEEPGNISIEEDEEEEPGRPESISGIDDAGTEEETAAEEEMPGEEASEETEPEEETPEEKEPEQDIPEEETAAEEEPEQDIPEEKTAAKEKIPDPGTVPAQQEKPASAAEKKTGTGTTDQSGDGNCAVEGKTPEKAFQAAVSKIKKIHAETGRNNPVSKTRAGKLNTSGVLSVEEKIKGRDLIIEEAGDLNDRSISELLTMMAKDSAGRSIILADNPLQIRKLMTNHPALADVFRVESLETTEEAELTGGGDTQKIPAVKAAPAAKKAEGKIPAEKPIESPIESPIEKPIEKPIKKQAEKPIERSSERPAEETSAARKTGQKKPRPKEDVSSVREDPAYAEEELDIDEFTNYASDYARGIDCVITGKSMLALYERVEIMEEDGIKLTRKNAEALIEEAADKAEKPPLIKKLGGLFSPKYDHDGLLILKEENFIS